MRLHAVIMYYAVILPKYTLMCKAATFYVHDHGNLTIFEYFHFAQLYTCKTWHLKCRYYYKCNILLLLLLLFYSTTFIDWFSYFFRFRLQDFPTIPDLWTQCSCKCVLILNVCDKLMKFLPSWVEKILLLPQPSNRFKTCGFLRTASLQTRDLIEYWCTA